MPTFRPGRLTAIAYDKLDASLFLNAADWTHSLSNAETTHFKSTAREFIAGQLEGTLSLAGMYDGWKTGDAGISADSYLESLHGSANTYPITMFFDGGALVGTRCAIASAYGTSYAPSSPVGGVVNIKLDAVVNGRPIDGFCVSPDAAIVTATTVNYASVDNAVSSAAGTTFVVHVTANTWSGNTTVKLQHSVDNSAWVDLITQVVPATTQIAYQLSSSGTVNRYVRAIVTTAAGSGAVTVLAAYARN